jgi:hypothetical protein
LRQGQPERRYIDGSKEKGREVLASLNDVKFACLLYRIDGVAVLVRPPAFVTLLVVARIACPAASGLEAEPKQRA